MKIIYSTIKNNVVEIDRSFEFEDFLDIYLVKEFKGRLEKVGKRYILSGDLSYSLTSKCDRCLESMAVDGEAVISQVISNIEIVSDEVDSDGLTDEEIDVYVTAIDHFDIDEFLREEVLLLTPSKKLCSEECGGINY